MTCARRSSSTQVQPPGAAPRSTQTSPGSGARSSQRKASASFIAARDGAASGTCTRRRPPGASDGASRAGTTPTATRSPGGKQAGLRVQAVFGERGARIGDAQRRSSVRSCASVGLSAAARAARRLPSSLSGTQTSNAHGCGVPTRRERRGDGVAELRRRRRRRRRGSPGARRPARRAARARRRATARRGAERSWRRRRTAPR